MSTAHGGKPGEMRAVVLPRFGGPDVLALEQRKRPRASGADVVVEVGACGVCRHDLLTRQGAFPDIGLPVVLGHAIAGRVAEVGPEADRLSVGDRVVSTVFVGCGACENCLAGRQTLCVRRPIFIGEDVDGGYAEYVAAPEWGWLPLRANISDAEATGLTCMVGTAYHAVVTRGGAVADERVLVTGASGGVGQHVLEVLRALDCHVIAVTTRSSKQAMLEALGADHVIVSTDGRYARAAKEATAGTGVDLVVDIVGGSGLNESVHSVRPGGRVVLVGNVEGGEATIKPAYLILKEVSLIGTKAVTTAEMDEVMSMVADRRLAVHVEEIVPLERAADVHRALEAGTAHGRTVLAVRPEGGSEQ